jgi:hypothetical protein
VSIVNGTYDAAAQNFNNNDLTITSTGVSTVIIIPTFSGSSGMWYNITQSNITISNVIVRHTYNYASWTGDLSYSSPLIVLADSSILTVSGVTFTSGDQATSYTNPLIFSRNAGNSVNINYTVFLNISQARVSLLHDYYATPFVIINSTFTYVDPLILFLF